MVDYLQTLTDIQQNHSQILEKLIILVFGRVPHVSLTSPGFVEVYITDFWIVE